MAATGSPHRRHFALDPAISFLNHGSFGACPTAVLEAQQELRARLEREPVRFFVRELGGLLDEARGVVAGFVGADPDDLAFVPNATCGVNTVLRSLTFAAGDELLTTSHAYNACANALRFVAGRVGASVTIAEVPFPLRDPGAIVDAILAAVTARTRLALIDHVTSPTGLVFPIAELTRALEGRGVPVLVDGAHAPGMLPLDVRAIGASYYTGNLHKWVCAPKGAAFLHVRRELQATIRPLSISHGANAPLGTRSRFRVEFDWTGTSDPTPYLCVPAALRTVAALLPGGFPAVMAANREKVLAGRRALCEALGVAAPCPEELVGSLAAVELPDGDPAPPVTPLYSDPLQDRLLFERGIEVPVVPWPRPPRRLVRISGQLYVDPAEYVALGAALRELLPIAGR